MKQIITINKCRQVDLKLSCILLTVGRHDITQRQETYGDAVESIAIVTTQRQWINAHATGTCRAKTKGAIAITSWPYPLPQIFRVPNARGNGVSESACCPSSQRLTYVLTIDIQRPLTSAVARAKRAHYSRLIIDETRLFADGHRSACVSPLARWRIFHCLSSANQAINNNCCYCRCCYCMACLSDNTIGPNILLRCLGKECPKCEFRSLNCLFRNNIGEANVGDDGVRLTLPASSQCVI